ncbi:MAG TPA: PAS domain-containing sensor histidine kinase [Chloroflexia bacterium]|jgi:PAS domain S-box-containing protein
MHITNHTSPGATSDTNHLALAVDATPVLLAYVDSGYRFAFANNAFAQCYGLTVPQVSGKRVDEVLDEGTYVGISTNLEAALNGQPLDFEVAPASTEGRYLHVSLVPDLDQQGQAVGVVVTISDVTERTLAEADLRRREQELRDFIENGAVGLHWVGPDGKILWANRAELQLLGYGEDEYIGHDIAEFHADGNIISDILRRLSAKETLHGYEARLRAKDGTLKHVLISSNVLWDEDGRFVHTRCFTRDITERKLAEEALRESEERNRAVLEQVSEAIFLLDPDTKRFVVANPAFQRLLGYTAQELAGMQIYDVLPYDRERIDRTVQRALDSGEYYVSDRLYSRKDGTLVSVEVGITPVSYGGKRVLCQVIRDITERRKNEEERNQLLESAQSARTAAEEALRMRDELLAIVSHDLKNPLAAIKGNIQLARRRVQETSGVDSGRVVGILDRIDEAQAKMNMLINELMDFGRLQAGLPLTLQRRPTDLLALVHEVVTQQQQTTARHNMSVEANVPELVGSWDAERLERVIANLLSNAVKYSPSGGEITVEVAQETVPAEQPGEEAETWATITVRDLGLGISGDDMPHIFEWFRRASDVSGRISGAGIGLASSLRAVQQHGGTISVDSQPGVGSCFTVRLPAGR